MFSSTVSQTQIYIFSQFQLENFTSGVPGFTETTRVVNENTMINTIEWRRNVPFTTNGAPPLKFKAYNPEGSIYFSAAVFHKNIAQSESVSLSAPNS